MPVKNAPDSGGSRHLASIVSGMAVRSVTSVTSVPSRTRQHPQQAHDEAGVKGQAVDLQAPPAQGPEDAAEGLAPFRVADDRPQRPEAGQRQSSQGLDFVGSPANRDVRNADHPLVYRQPSEVEAKGQSRAGIVRKHRRCPPKPQKFAFLPGVGEILTNDPGQARGQRIVFGPGGQVDDGLHPKRPARPPNQTRQVPVRTIVQAPPRYRPGMLAGAMREWSFRRRGPVRAASRTRALVLAWSIAAGADPTPEPVAPAASASATVHVVVDYAAAVIETKSSVDRTGWSYACSAPCDRPLQVEDQRLRVRAPGMTSSNEFRIEPGSGTARLRVSGGSATARTAGVIALAGGVPLALGGTALIGLGTVDEKDGVRTAGIVTLAVGAAAIVAALPLLLVGSTRVYDGRGAAIAQHRGPSRW